MPKARRIELGPLFRRQFRQLPARTRARLGDDLLALAAAVDTDVHTIPHPDHPGDRFVRRLVGVGYRATVLVYPSRVEAVTVYPD